MSQRASLNVVFGALGLSLVTLSYSFLTGEGALIAGASAMVALSIAFWLQ